MSSEPSLEVSAAVSQMDSERFGLTIARADAVVREDIPALLRFCDRNEVEMVIARCDGRDLAAVRGLVDAGMNRYEAQITYEGELKELPQAAEVREGSEADAAAIEAISRTGFHDMPSHYHADPRLSMEACMEAYVDWSLRGLRGEAADVFFVAEIDRRPIGFMMFAADGDRVTSILSTIDPQHRGRRLYHALFARGMAWGLASGAATAIGVTPYGNVAAQRNLIGLGLKPVGSTATFHGWRDELQRPG